MKIIAKLPDSMHYRQIQNKGERYQWVDKANENFRIVAPVANPWGKNWQILIGIVRGKTRAEIEYPRHLSLVCHEIDPAKSFPQAEIRRERWSGNFAHTEEPVLFFAAFPASTDYGQSWLMLSIVEFQSL
jgi:hypothetical protein